MGNIDMSSFSRAVSGLNSQCLSLLDSHAPIQTKRITVVDTAQWFDKEYRELRKLRRRLEKKAKKPGAELEVKIAYHDACSDCTKLAITKKKTFFSNVIDRSGNNPKTLYKLVNSALDRKQEKPLPDYSSDIGELAKDFDNFFIQKIKTIRSNMPEAQLHQLITRCPTLFYTTSVSHLKMRSRR